MLKTLEKAGLITRRRSTKDERVLMITITEAGLALKAKAVEIPAAIRAGLGLDEKELQTLMQLLDKMLISLGEE